MTDDIVEFVNARLREDEEHARASRTPDEWRLERDGTSIYPTRVSRPRIEGLRDATVAIVLAVDRVDAQHIARHDPARVLRGVEAKRRLVKDLLAQSHFLDNREWYGCRSITEDDTPTGEPCTCGRDEDVERRLRLMASEWADHSAYRHEEWKS